MSHTPGRHRRQKGSSPDLESLAAHALRPANGTQQREAFREGLRASMLRDFDRAGLPVKVATAMRAEDADGSFSPKVYALGDGVTIAHIESLDAAEREAAADQLAAIVARNAART